MCQADILLHSMEGDLVVIEASHTVSSGLNVACHMLIMIEMHTDIHEQTSSYNWW